MITDTDLRLMSQGHLVISGSQVEMAKEILSLRTALAAKEAETLERAAKVADEFVAADRHLKELAREDKDAIGALVHAYEEGTGLAIAAGIRALKEAKS